MVSIIIPAYNAEAFIGRAILSALGQTYSPIEVVVVNDGSKDGTRAITEAFAEKDKRIKLISVENGGVSRARNIGMDNASGDYIMFLDADDELYPDAAEAMRNCLRETDADICRTLAHRVSSQETKLERKADGKKQIWDAKTGIQMVIRDHPATYAVWAKMYRREKLEKIRFPEGKRFHEDSFFVFLCLLSGMRMVLCDYVTYRYYVTTGSASRSGFNEKMFDMLELAKEKMRLIDEKYPEFRGQTNNVLIKAHMALLSNLCKHRGTQYAAYEKASIRFVRKNKTAFVPASRVNKRWHWIIIHHMYYPYKLAYMVKNKLRI